MVAVASSYITTIADLETRLSNDPRAAAIALLAASDAVQTWYLQRATRNIDSLSFAGYKYLSSQTLQFPRKFQLDPERDSPCGETLATDMWGYHYQSEVPDEIENATIEEAIALYDFYVTTSSESTQRMRLQSQGVKSFSIGDLSESYGGGSSLPGSMKSVEAYEMISRSGYLEMAPLIQ